MNINEKLASLKSTELFKFLPEATLIALAQRSTVLEINAGHTIFEQGDEGNGLYVIITGDVKIIRHGKLIAEAHENGFFGELALMGNIPRTASVITKTKCKFIFINKETYDEVINTLPQVIQSSMRLTIRYLREYLP